MTMIPGGVNVYTSDTLRRVIHREIIAHGYVSRSLACWIASHPNVPLDWVDTVLTPPRMREKMLGWAVRRIGIEKGEMYQHSQRNALYFDAHFHRALAANPNLTPSQLRRIWGLRRSDRWPGAALLNLSVNPATPSDVVESMADVLILQKENNGLPTLQKIAAHPNLPLSASVKMAVHFHTVYKNSYDSAQRSSAMKAATVLAGSKGMNVFTQEAQRDLIIWLAVN